MSWKSTVVLPVSPAGTVRRSLLNRPSRNLPFALMVNVGLPCTLVGLTFSTVVSMASFASGYSFTGS
jgi:hypothetical protein